MKAVANDRGQSEENENGACMKFLSRFRNFDAERMRNITK